MDLPVDPFGQLARAIRHPGSPLWVLDDSLDDDVKVVQLPYAQLDGEVVGIHHHVGSVLGRG